MKYRTFKLYTGEKLTKKEEIQLIKERISELQLDINIANIEIQASKNSIKYFEDKLKTLEISE